MLTATIGPKVLPYPPVIPYEVQETDLHGFRLIKGIMTDRLVRGDWTIYLPIIDESEGFLLEDYYRQFSKHFRELEAAIAWADYVESKDWNPNGEYTTFEF